jgi:3-methylcrotonyl-CoA carboxylase alpha subunit
VTTLLCGDHAHEVEEGGEIEDLGGGVFFVRDGDAGEPIHCVRRGDAVHLFWRGAAYVLQEETEDYRAAHRQHHSGALEAPMPGKVIAVKVEAGQAVVRGQELLVVEAMKMENAIRAPRDGRIKAVSAAVGDAVSPGTILVELEE